MEPMDAAWSLLKEEPTDSVPLNTGNSNDAFNISFQDGRVTPFLNLGARKKVDWEALAEIYGDDAVKNAQRASKVLQFGAGASALWSIMNSLGAEGNTPFSSLIGSGLMGAYGAHETVMAAEPWATEQAAQWGLSPEKIQEGRERYRQKQEDESIDRGVAARNRRTQREEAENAPKDAIFTEVPDDQEPPVEPPVAPPVPPDVAVRQENNQQLLAPPVAVAGEPPTTQQTDDYWSQWV